MMAIESFKKGDKVELRDPMSRIQRNNIGTVVIESTPSMPLITVEWKENGTSRKQQYLPSEIKRVFPKGKQLLFPFMYEN